MATYILVNIDSGNGLLPDGTKPLPEPMLTYQQRCSVTFKWEEFHMKVLSIWFLKYVRKLHSETTSKLHGDNELIEQIEPQTLCPSCRNDTSADSVIIG